MNVHPGVFVSSTSTDDWRADPEIGGGAEEHVLFDVGNIRAGMSRFTEHGPDTLDWVLPQSEVLLVLEGGAGIDIQDGPTLVLKAGDMAYLPSGAVTRWTLTLPFKEMWVLVGDRTTSAMDAKTEAARSSTSTDDWQPDPEIGEAADVHFLIGDFETGHGAMSAGLSRFATTGLVSDESDWVVPQTEVLLVLEGGARIVIEDGPTLDLRPGDMATLPKGTKTQWDITAPFLEMWVLAEE